jgi:hypothetical protein
MSKKPSPIVRAVFADLLVALAAVTLSASAGSAAPTETCLATPNSTAPDGSHWYFRTDRTTQRKCWYLAAQGHKVHRITRSEPADEEPAARPARSKRESGTESSAVQAAAPQAPVPREDPQERMQRFVFGAAAQAGEPAAERTPQLAAEASPVATAGVLPWPAASQPALNSDVADAAADTPAAAAVAPSEAQDSAPAARSTSQVAAATAADPAPVTPLQMLLLFVAALAIAGSLLHTIFKLALARRHRVYVDRREGEWSTNRAYEHALPHDFDAPMRAPSDVYAAARGADAERLTQLLRDIERRAAAA